MAVLNDFPGLETAIIVNEAPLAEFEDDEAQTSPTEANKYIEAQTGAAFGVRTTISKPFPKVFGVEIEVWVDGHRTSRCVVKPDEQFYTVPNDMKGVAYRKDGKIHFKEYQFEELLIGIVAPQGTWTVLTFV